MAFSTDSTRRADQLVVKATEEDLAKNYEEACRFYEDGVKLYLHALKHELVAESAKESLRAKCTHYLDRADKMKEALRKADKAKKKEVNSIHGLNWQLKAALDDQELMDVTLLIGVGNERFEANKFILSLRSEVFKTMFSSRWNRNNNGSDKKRKRPRSDNDAAGTSGVRNDDDDEEGSNNETIVKIPDTNPIAFRVFLKYLYTDELELSIENVVSICNLGRKYLINPIVDQCLKFIQKSLNAGNVLEIFEKSLIGDDGLNILESDVQEVCLKFICSKAQELITSEGFLSLSGSALELIIKCDELQVDEVALFKRVYWYLYAMNVKDSQ